MYITAEERSYTEPHGLAGCQGHSFDTACAWRVLEEIDYGLILVSHDGEIQHANHLARHELARERFLRLQGHRLAGATPSQTCQILGGVQRAGQGRREMIVLRHADQCLHVACVPLFHAYEEAGSVLLMLARQSDTANLALAFFSRSHRLTAVEESVLKSLCDGLRVPEIATVRGVSLHTVRTHVRSLRDKTGIHSIRGMIQRVATLPPVVPMSLTLPPRPTQDDL